MKITLNLATRPYADQGPALKQLRIGMGVLAGVLILLGLGWLHFHQSALKMAAQQEALERSIAQIQKEELGYQAQMKQPENARVLTQSRFLNQLFDEKSFSWTAAMEDLERVMPAGVQVTAIEPERGKDGVLTLKLRVAGQRERAVQLVRNMEHTQRFADPRVAAENAENNAQGGLTPVQETGRVNFDILAEYNPATLEERKEQLAHDHNNRAKVESPSSVVSAASRPGYVPPNPQPVQPTRAFQGQMRLPRGQGGQIPPQIMGPMRGSSRPPDPTGYDPNGLKNHDRNRIPDPSVPQGGPQ